MIHFRVAIVYVSDDVAFSASGIRDSYFTMSIVAVTSCVTNSLYYIFFLNRYNTLYRFTHSCSALCIIISINDRY